MGKSRRASESGAWSVAERQAPGWHPVGRPAPERALARLVAGAVCAAFAPGLCAAVDPRAGDFAELSLEQLGSIEITTVSRKSESLADAPASVYVITAEAIRRSGVTTLPEALRLAPNLQVARINASQYAISARGFNSSTANKLQVLIDGRIVYTPLYSGVFWDAQDVMLEDIERIEVISGPASTLWGANAMNGVINIISRSARGTTGNLLSAGAGNLEHGAAFRHGAALGEGGAYRVYAKVQNLEHSELADGSPASDGFRRALAGFRADLSAPGSTATIQGDAYQDAIEQPRLDRQRNSGANLLGRWEKALDGGGSLRVQAYWDHAVRSVPGLFGEKRDTLDVNFQHTLPEEDDQQLIWGGGYRAADDRVDNRSPLLAFLPADRTLHWARLFAQQERQLAPALRLTLGARVEHNSYTGLEFMPNLRLAWKPADSHLLWAALSRSVRTPSRVDTELFSPARPPYILVGRSDFESEIAKTAELGYRGQFGDSVSVSLTAFNSLYDRLRSLETRPGGVFVLGNQLRGRVYGIEAWGSWQINRHWRLGAGVTGLHERFNADAASAPPGNDPDVQWSLTSSWQWATSQEFDLAVRHVGALPNPTVPAYTAVDARYGWRVSRDLAVSLGVTNLFDPRHGEFASTAAGPVQFQRAAYLAFRVAF
jgi:iron complex outermembrane recepter protein